MDKVTPEPSFFDSSSTYKYVNTIIYYGIYYPIVAMLMFVSKGQHSAYSYPTRPFATSHQLTTHHGYWKDFFRMYVLCICDTDTKCGGQKVGKSKTFPDDHTSYRLRKVHALTDFLASKVHLPHTWQVHGSGPRDLAYDVFLTQAGGKNAMDAEIVANALVDVHIDSELVLLEMARDNDLKGWISEVPGIDIGAAQHIIRYLQTHE